MFVVGALCLSGASYWTDRMTNILFDDSVKDDELDDVKYCDVGCVLEFVNAL